MLMIQIQMIHSALSLTVLRTLQLQVSITSDRDISLLSFPKNWHKMAWVEYYDEEISKVKQMAHAQYENV